MFPVLVPLLELKDVVFLSLVFIGISFWSGVIIAKLAPNSDKTEKYKLSLAIITSSVFFNNWVISLGLLDTYVALGSYTLLTM